MKNPLLSVILPYFDAADSIQAAIESILHQTFTDFEFILIDNNANFETNKIVKQFSRKEARIKIITERRQGIAFALNTGIAASNGEFIARMDADDVSLSERLEKQISFLLQNPDIDVVSCQTSIPVTSFCNEGFRYYVEWQNTIILPEQHSCLRFIESPIAHPSVMFRRSLTERYGLYSTDPIPEDYELWLRWMAVGVRFCKIPEMLVYWNDGGSRLSRNHPHYSKDAFLKIKIHYLSAFIRNNISPDKKVIICGSSKTIINKAMQLQDQGIEIYGFTDVRHRVLHSFRFIHIKEIKIPDGIFLVNFIEKRGVGNEIRNHLLSINFTEGKDFIIAG